MRKFRRFYVIFKGGKEQFVSAKTPAEAIREVRNMLPKYEVVGYYEV